MFTEASIPHILQQADIFADLDSTQLALIASISDLREYQTGDIIFEENSASNELYVIADGEIDIKVDPSILGERANGPVTLTTLRRGQSFGEMALVDHNLRSASACCAQHETMLVIIPKDRLTDLCTTHPQLGYILMRNLAIDLAAKMRSTGNQLRDWLTWAHS